jgi:hypothetical protein
MAIRRKTVFQQPMVFRAQVPWYIPQEADRKPGDVNPAMKAMDFHGPAFPPVVLPLKNMTKTMDLFQWNPITQVSWSDLGNKENGHKRFQTVPGSHS